MSAPAPFWTLVVAWMIPGTSPSMWSAFILADRRRALPLAVLADWSLTGSGISKRSIPWVGETCLGPCRSGLTITI